MTKKELRDWMAANQMSMTRLAAASSVSTRTISRFLNENSKLGTLSKEAIMRVMEQKAESCDDSAEGVS